MLTSPEATRLHRYIGILQQITQSASSLPKPSRSNKTAKKVDIVEHSVA